MMHHANLLVGNKEWARTRIPREDIETSVDVVVLDFERMNVKDVRALIYEAGMRPTERSYRVFIISCVSILHEAQNALLKLFEEPNAHTLFYFIIPRMDMLLPTLRSRLNVLGIEERGVMHSEVRDFFSASYANRLALIAKKIDAEDTSWIQSLIESLAGYAHTSKQQSLIRDILLLESYVHAAGSSKKMLLEHVALTFPEKIIV